MIDLCSFAIFDIARPAMWLLHMHTLRCQCWNDILCSPSTVGTHIHTCICVSLYGSTYRSCHGNQNIGWAQEMKGRSQKPHLCSAAPCCTSTNQLDATVLLEFQQAVDKATQIFTPKKVSLTPCNRYSICLLLHNIMAWLGKGEVSPPLCLPATSLVSLTTLPIMIWCHPHLSCLTC